MRKRSDGIFGNRKNRRHPSDCQSTPQECTGFPPWSVSAGARRRCQANSQVITDLPWVLLIVLYYCGEADCHRCAHWFAMTCGRRGRCCGCKKMGRDAYAEGRGGCRIGTRPRYIFFPRLGRPQSSSSSVVNSSTSPQLGQTMLPCSKVSSSKSMTSPHLHSTS